ncbi:MAG: PorT family protein [Bacteroidia bacterium]|nr:PorT family protein [Bacteroidia bacterium]
MKKKWIFAMLLIGSVTGVWAQKNDTTVIKEGNREVKIIMKDGKDNKSKDVVVYKKYVITDSTNIDEILGDTKEGEIITDSAGRKKIIRKQVVIVDQNENGKIVRKIDVNIPDMDSLESVIEREMEIAQIEIEKNAEKLERKGKEIEEDVEEWVEEEGETEVIVGDRKIIIERKDGDMKVIMKRKNKDGEWIEEKRQDGEGDSGNVIEEKEIEIVEDNDNGNEGCCEREKRKAVDVDLFGLDLGWNNFITDGKVGKNPVEMMEMDNLRSMHVTSHFLPTRVSLFGNGAVSLKSAISLNINNFRYKNDFILNPDADYVTPVASSEPYSKNKLVSTFLQIPLLLNFKTRPHRESSVELSMGGYAGYLLDAKTKRVDMEGTKLKDHDDYNLNPLKYGVTARLDFKWFDFYVNYNLSNFFADGQGPKTQLVEAGVNLLNY